MTIDDAAIERLVTEAQRGDAWAFGMIFDHYHESIYRFIASRVHRPTDAEDLTQHVFVKALEALPRYESRGIPFGGWLFRLARNAVIDFVRTRHDHLELDVLQERSANQALPDEILVARQQIDAVGIALTALTDEQRAAIALRLFTGWRRASFALAAATLAGLMLGTSVFAASSAGGPLYGTRLWLETATLPSDANARAAAELQRLQSRLGDTADAAVRGDGN